MAHDGNPRPSRLRAGDLVALRNAWLLTTVVAQTELIAIIMLHAMKHLCQRPFAVLRVTLNQSFMYH